MTLSQSIELRAVLGVSLSVGSVVAWQLAPRLRVTADRFSRLFLAAFAATRFGLFALVFGVLHMAPRGDITLYMDEAAQALAGKLVYRDFRTPHAPLSPYLLASILRLHHSPFTIILFCIVCDVAAVWIWLRIGRLLLSPLVLRRAALLLLFNPTGLLTEAIDGQVNSIVALILALAVYSLVYHRAFLSGVLAAIPAAAIRFTCLIFAPGFLFASRRKLLGTLGFVSLLLLAYGGFAFAGANLSVPFKMEGDHETCSNLTYLLEMVTGKSLGLRVPDLMLATTWLGTVGLTFFAMRSCSANTQPDRRRTFFLLTISLIAELLCIVVFAKTSWDRYFVMTMFPLCLVAAELSFAEVCGYALFTAAAVWEPSYYAALFWPTSLAMHARVMAGDRHALLLLAVEILEVSGSLYLWITCLRRLAGRAPGSASTLPDPFASSDLPLLPLQPEPA